MKNTRKLTTVVSQQQAHVQDSKQENLWCGHSLSTSPMFRPVPLPPPPPKKKNGTALILLSRQPPCQAVLERNIEREEVRWQWGFDTIFFTLHKKNILFRYDKILIKNYSIKIYFRHKMMLSKFRFILKVDIYGYAIVSSKEYIST